MKFFIFQFLCFSLVVCIAIRVCIFVPASLVTRRAELSSKSNTVAGALSPNLHGRLGITWPVKLLLKVNVRVYSFSDREDSTICIF